MTQMARLISQTGVSTGGPSPNLGRIKRGPSFRAIAVEPDRSPFFLAGPREPIKLRDRRRFVPRILNTNVIDEIIRVRDEDGYHSPSYWKEEGIPAGISSGASPGGIAGRCSSRNAGKMIIVILASSAERYLSTALVEAL